MQFLLDNHAESRQIYKATQHIVMVVVSKDIRMRYIAKFAMFLNYFGSLYCLSRPESALSVI